MRHGLPLSNLTAVAKALRVGGHSRPLSRLFEFMLTCTLMCTRACVRGVWWSVCDFVCLCFCVRACVVCVGWLVGFFCILLLGAILRFRAKLAGTRLIPLVCGFRAAGCCTQAGLAAADALANIWGLGNSGVFLYTNEEMFIGRPVHTLHTRSSSRILRLSAFHPRGTAFQFLVLCALRTESCRTIAIGPPHLSIAPRVQGGYLRYRVKVDHLSSRWGFAPTTHTCIARGSHGVRSSDAGSATRRRTVAGLALAPPAARTCALQKGNIYFSPSTVTRVTASWSG
jgi:hypothetical protein